MHCVLAAVRTSNKKTISVAAARSAIFRTVLIGYSARSTSCGLLSMHVLHRRIVQSTLAKEASDVVIPECDALWSPALDARETILMLLALLCSMQ